MARSNQFHDAKKEALAQAALDLFIEHGYENTKIKQIMEAAGLTAAGMYHYFTSKEEILDAAIEIGITKDLDALAKEIKGMSPLEKLYVFTKGATDRNSMIEKMRRFQKSHQRSYATYRIRECEVYAYVPVLEQILLEGIEQGVFTTDYPRPTAEFMVLLGHAISPRSSLLPEAGPEGMKERAEAFFTLIQQWLQADPEQIAAFLDLQDKLK